MEEISKEEYLAAVTEGVRRAVALGMPSSAEILEEIKLILSCAFSDVDDAITTGVEQSFPWPSEILNAIGNAAEHAISKRRGA